MNDEKLSITELWEEVQFFVNNRVDDNNHCDEYPLETRISQMGTLHQLVKLINFEHLRLSDEQNDGARAT